MKYLLLLLICTPFVTKAQKDFDYSFYTTQVKMNVSDNTDTLTTFIGPRRIVKTASVLQIISLTNTTDVITYRVRFMGFSFNKGENMEFVYSCTDTQDVIYVNPIWAIVSINRHTMYF